ncbi:MAG: hypothetical protein AAF573_07850, partial [Bacteroidota bacterium]
SFIDEKTYHRLITYYQFTRRALYQVESNYIWRFSDLFTWAKPDFMTVEEWESEQQLFKNSIQLTKDEALAAANAYISNLQPLPAEATPPAPEPSPFEKMWLAPEEQSAGVNKNNSSKNKSRSAAKKKRKKRVKPKRNKKKKRK